MLRRLVLLSFALVLAACSSTNVQQDFDASRDFAAYRSWAWQEPGLQYRPDDPRIKSDLTEQRIRTAVAEQLDQRGLRPVQGGARPDLTVRTYLIVEQRQQQITTNYGGAGVVIGAVLGWPHVQRNPQRRLQGGHHSGRPFRWP